MIRLFKHIESVDFTTDFTVISGFKVFQQALDKSDVLRQLINSLKAHPPRKKKMLERLICLLGSSNDPEQLHPYDIAIAVYLYALSKVDIILAFETARKLCEIPNLWWARRLANAVLDSMKTATIQASMQVEGAEAYLSDRVTFVSDSTEPQTRIVVGEPNQPGYLLETRSVMKSNTLTVGVS